MRMLPESRRQAMFAVYAFCRAVDDIADGPGSKPEKSRALAAWRGEVRDLFRDQPAHPCVGRGHVAHQARAPSLSANQDRM